jgi:predicted nucleotidyltransferase
MRRDDVIASITRTLEADESVAALFLSGSLGRGTADRFSDIDLLAVAPGRAHGMIAMACRTSLARSLPIVFWRERKAEGLLINCVTEDWVRIDVLLTDPERLAAHAQDALKPLFDREGLYDRLPPTSPSPRPSLARVASLIDEFLRVLGLLVVVVGREEFETGVVGAGLLRTLLTDLLLEAAESTDKGGALHLSRILTPEQLRVLRDLPSPLPTRDTVVEAHLAAARAFLPLARTLAAQLDLPWPSAFEAATWDYLNRELGIARRS